MTDAILPEYRGWRRIVETSQWDNRYLDDLGAALLSLTGHADRLGMHGAREGDPGATELSRQVGAAMTRNREAIEHARGTDEED